MSAINGTILSFTRDLENECDQNHEADASQKGHSGSKFCEMLEGLRRPVRRIPNQFRLMVFTALLAVLAAVFVGLPLYGVLVATQFGDTSVATAVNMPQETSSQLYGLVTGKDGEMTLLQHPTQASFVGLKVTVQDFDIIRLKATIDMELIAAGNFSNPEQPAALLLPNNTQMVLQTANIMQSYATGAVPGAFAVTVPLTVQRQLLFYPFDAFAADLVISIALEQEHTPLRPSSTPASPLPLVVGVRNNVETMHVPLQLSSFRELKSGPGAAAEPQPGPVTIYLRAQGRHTPFVRAYVVVLTLVVVALGLILTAVALDYSFVRPRPLDPAVLGAYIGVLFSVPMVRSSLPGGIPVGMMIDIFGFAWAIIMTGGGLLMMISVIIGQFSHKAKLFHAA